MSYFEPLDERNSDLPLDTYLKPTSIIDSDNLNIVKYASSILGSTKSTDLQKAIKLYYAVRDGIWYDLNVPFHLAEHYRAGNVLKRGRGYCVYKASLLCALGRAADIPSRLGFADVSNHLASKKLLKKMGTNVFAFHGYVEFFLDGKWVKATPAFNKELCEKHNVPPLEFDGIHDSIFHTYDRKKNLFMEYIRDHGTFSDVPVDRIVARWKEVYGADRVEKWIKDLELKNK